MADTSEPDGLKNPDEDSALTRVQFENGVTNEVPMDGDCDGAPGSLKPAQGQSKEANANNDSGDSTPRRASSRGSRGVDLSTVDMKTSWDGSAVSTGSSKGENVTTPQGYVVAFKAKAGMLADPVKIAKEREKEERVRQARERLAEERRRKLEELREQQRIAQENREKQLEMRRKKIEDLRRRDVERRAAVEERRRMKEEIEKARRESILQKAEERVARYEAWKAGGRKGGRGHILGFGSATPRDICQPFERPRRSSSHSALQRLSPNGSDLDSVRPQRRALSACSAVRRRHCCVDSNKMGMFGSGNLSISTSILYHKRHPDFASMSVLAQGSPRPQEATPGTQGFYHYPRPSAKSPMVASMPSPVRLREKGPRKQRPASVASSMPSFVGGEPAKSPRSHSTDRPAKSTRSQSSDRPARDRSKSRPMKERVTKDAKTPEKSDGDEKKKTRVSLSIFDRLATPKFHKVSAEVSKDVSKEATPKKDAPIIRVQFADRDQDGIAEPKLSPRKAYSTSNLATMQKRSSFRDKPSPKQGASKPSTPSTPSTTPSTTHHRPTRGSTPRAAAAVAAADKAVTSPERVASPARPASPGVKVSSGSSTPRVTPPPHMTPPPAPSTVAPVEKTSEDGTPTPRTQQDITAEEYKARLAEKRRQARERAEREAEEERKRIEEERLAEEERQRQQEEEDRRQEEEALRLAAEARKQEEERLQKAIEAEEKRKKEEAERLEQEKKAREESDRKAKLEAERLEKEKQERAKREEEERLQRKKKLESIMKRVKSEASPSKTDSTDNKQETATSRGMAASWAPTVTDPMEVKTDSIQSSVIQDSVESSTPQTSEEGENIVSQSRDGESTVGESSVPESTARESPESGAEVSTPDKTELNGAVVKSASSGDIGDNSPDKPKFKSPLLQQLVEKKSSDSSPKFKSPLLQNLLGKTKVGARMGLSHSMGDLSGESNKETSKQGLEEDKDEDTAESGTHKTEESPAQPITTHSTDEDSSTEHGTDMKDSALGLSLGPQDTGEGASLHNGHHSMEDSSICLEPVVTSPARYEPEKESGDDSSQFEELIDLLDGPKTPSTASQHPPIIAFDENRRTDVTESLS